MTLDPWKFLTETTPIAPEALEEYLTAREAVDAAEEALWKAERALHTDKAVGADNTAVQAEYRMALAAWKAATLRLRAA